MDTPTRDQVAAWLAEHRHPTAWADFLVGLPQHIIEPVVQIAANSRTHPALALGMVAARTSDPEVKRIASRHIASRDPGPAAPNRASRRAAARK